MKQFYVLFIITTLMFALIGCNGSVKGPSVERSTAIKIAKDSFNIVTVKKVDLRHLSDEEINNMLSKKTKKLTPIYFVIQGIDNN